MSIILDGMDQSKTDLPHLLRKNKSACNLWVLRTHLTGAIAHGRRSYAFLDVHLWPHDSNLTTNILLQILVRQEQLPPTLYLQLDNCYRENKNQFLFGFIALLVHHRIFKEVSYIHMHTCRILYPSLNFEYYILLQYFILLSTICLCPQIEVGFLMVGHTHEDIDQFFSKLSQYLRRNSAHTLPGK